jgi:thiol-disulfide isomerase/thioredoxin
MRGLALAAAAALLLTGCASDPDAGLLPGSPEVDVDTPHLRQLKSEAGVEDCVPGTSEPVADGLPEVTLPCLGGGPEVDLSSLHGPLVVNLWAGWCGPCRQELPIYQRFHEKYDGRVDVLGIDYNDTQPGAALELVQQTGVTYPLLADPGSLLDGESPLPRIPGLPMLVLVDADGVVVHQEFVVIRRLGQLEGLVEEHLGVRA